MVGTTGGESGQSACPHPTHMSWSHVNLEHQEAHASFFCTGGCIGSNCGGAGGAGGGALASPSAAAMVIGKCPASSQRDRARCQRSRRTMWQRSAQNTRDLRSVCPNIEP